MKQANKEDYRKGVQARLKLEKEAKKHPVCGICGLNVRASGRTADERLENHQKGFHCKPAGTSKRGYR